MVKIARAKNLANCTFHNLRYYPMVQHLRRLRESGELGDILVVQGTYSQDWLLYDTDWNWRIDSKANGRSRTFGDIGTHWIDTISFILGTRAESVFAHLETFHKTRKRPRGEVKTFAKVDAKQWAATIERFDQGMTDLEALVQSAPEAKLAEWSPTIANISAHNAYHIGEIVMVRKEQGAWDPSKGVK